MPLTKQSAEELSAVLQLERKLLLNAQENYRRLKSRFVEVTAENQRLKEEQDQVIRETQEEQERLLAQADEAKCYAQQLVEEVDAEKRERQEHYEIFKAKTLNEIQSIYRSQLETVCVELTLNQDKCRRLVESNGILEAKVAALRRELADTELVRRKREDDLRTAHDAELLTLSRQIRESTRSELDIRRISEELQAEQARTQSLEEENLRLAQDYAHRMNQQDAMASDLERRLADADQRIAQMEVRNKGRIAELEKKKVDSDVRGLAEEGRRNADWSQRVGRYEASIEDLEQKLKEKDQQMKETSDQLRDFRGISMEAVRLQTSLRQSQQAYSRRVEELEGEKRFLKFNYEKMIQKLTWERDRATRELSEQRHFNNQSEGPQVAHLKQEVALRDQKILEVLTLQ
ncbi:Protein K10G6.4 [Aphelenchoides avenae]|nr:Protein K10G6.4 [Aphelenchus avenae]